MVKKENTRNGFEECAPDAIRKGVHLIYTLMRIGKYLTGGKTGGSQRKNQNQT